MRRALCLLGCLGLTLALAAPLAAAEAPAPPCAPAPEVQASPAAVPPALPEFLLGLEGARPQSNCPGPWECMQICFDRGCLTTDGCDGMGGCLCSNCS